ncbi:hypothetical protein MBLNU459_g5086t1 [Dothideomycetes sp. NU459]
MSRQDDEERAQHRYQAPHGSHRPIPTIQEYHREKEDRQAYSDSHNNYSRRSDSPEGEESKDPANRYLSSDEQSRSGSGHGNGNGNSHEGLMAHIHSGIDKSKHLGSKIVGNSEEKTKHGEEEEEEEEEGEEVAEDTSEAVGHATDLKDRRKGMKKRKGERAEREVTDPVTHLPVRIHDLTASDLKKVPENAAVPGTERRTATGLSNKTKSDEQLDSERAEMQGYHQSMVNHFPPPEYDAIRKELASVQSLGLTVGLVSIALVGFVFVVLERFLFSRTGTDLGNNKFSFGRISGGLIFVSIGVAAVIAIIFGVRTWMDHQISSLWEEELWHSQKREEKELGHSEETTHWLNSMLSSVWPLVNPDLFISLADTLEDVMQASLPSIVRMVSVEDIGQGSESVRILGVRWLPTGASARSVTADGKLQSHPPPKESTDRSVPGEGQIDGNTSDQNKQGSQDDEDQPESDKAGQEQMAEGMEAEEGDFINLEVAFAYRGRSSAKKFGERAKHAHLYMAFYLPGRIKLPVYVDLRGIVGIARMRLQLTPDPPFFSLMTFTFLGQPKVDLACIPLARKGLNIMDLPVISNFVQSAVDAAMAEYVAPKSLTLDLKDMLAGDDFKKDTVARGVIVCKIKRAFGFEQGDPGIPLIKEASADPYVTVGWAKFAKPLWSTRVIVHEMEPHWEETAFILVTPDELNVDERLRVQLWDSDRLTADDDLGRIEMDLKDLMSNSATKGKMSDRVDGFKALKAGEGMPGKLEWSVGYFGKTPIQRAQLKSQTAEPDIDTCDKLEEVVRRESERKLREAKKDETRVLKQLEAQEYKQVEDRMIIAARPLDEYPSGMLAIQIHECTGLEMRATHQADRDNDGNEASDEEETGEDLPSCYCNIILNHQKVYRTRVKPKNGKPFFNAGTERFIRDWRTAEVYITVRDARVHEDDSLMGLVRLPLDEVFKNSAQVNNTYPLHGGVGYGRVRVSLVFRSVNLQVGRNLIGWDFGTVVVDPVITGMNVPHDLQNLRLKLQTSISTGHMSSNDGQRWSSRNNKKIHLAVRKRYSSPLIIQFRKDSALRDRTSAFVVLWLTDLMDDEDTELTLPVWKGDLKRATTCYLRECGEQAGSITIKLRYCRGLSKYHNKMAKKDKNLRDIIETVDIERYSSAQMTKEQEGAVRNASQDGPERKPRSDNPNASEDSDSDDSSSGEELDDELDHHNDQHGGDENKQVQQTEDRNLVDSLKDYKAHSKEIHRKNRGIMQLKSARTLWWMKHKADNLQERIHTTFSHHENKIGVETEA